MLNERAICVLDVLSCKHVLAMNLEALGCGS